MQKSIEFEKTAELAVALTTQGLQDRHWNELKESIMQNNELKRIIEEKNKEIEQLKKK